MQRWMVALAAAPQRALVEARLWRPWQWLFLATRVEVIALNDEGRQWHPVVASHLADPNGMDDLPRGRARFEASLGSLHEKFPSLIAYNADSPPPPPPPYARPMTLDAEAVLVLARAIEQAIANSNDARLDAFAITSPFYRAHSESELVQQLRVTVAIAHERSPALHAELARVPAMLTAPRDPLHRKIDLEVIGRLIAALEGQLAMDPADLKGLAPPSGPPVSTAILDVPICESAVRGSALLAAYHELVALRDVPAPAEPHSVERELAALHAGGTLELPAGTIATPLVIERGVTVRGASEGRTMLASRPGLPAIVITGTSDEIVLERLVIRGGGGRHGAIAIGVPKDPFVLGWHGAPRVSIRDCVILDGACDAPDWPPGSGSHALLTMPGAGGITIAAGRVTLERCVLAGNRGVHGGAVGVIGPGDLDASTSLFVDNESSRGGGAVYVEGESSARLVHCTLADNRTTISRSNGGTLYARYANGGHPAVALVSSVIRGEGPSFGPTPDSGQAPVLLRACCVPESDRRYPRLAPDPSTTFGAVSLADGYAPAEPVLGPPATLRGEARDPFGRSLRTTDGLVRGGIAPAPKP